MATVLKEAFPVAFEHPQDRPKPRKPPRACPPDFEATFVKLGRFDCEAHFHARRSTITDWMVELGKQRLIDARAAYVAEERLAGKWITRSTRLIKHHEVRQPSMRETIRDQRKVSFSIVREAAHYLRIRRHGGMIVSPASNGDWFVGSKRLSAAQVLDLAKSRGFDDEAVAASGSASA